MSRRPETFRLSVVVPCFQAAETLPRQLDALTRQSWPGGWEVILADNGSTDGSPELAERWRDRLPGLRVVRSMVGRGPAHSRNVGARAASGDALVFCDADDEVGEGWLEAMGRALCEHDLVAARYDAWKLNPAWVVAARGEHQRDGLNPYTYPPFLPHAGGGGLGVLRRLHEEVGGFDESLPALEDTDYCWRLQLAGTPLVFVPEAVVHISFRADLSGRFRQSFRFGIYNVLAYRRYRSRGMPRLPWWLGLAKWARLLLTLPLLALPHRRGAWLHQLAWRTGRLVGCWRYRVWAP
ncbi:MAG TPA: glycosyltransferase family 2 protein [Thermoanaerobaculia bacterium]|nr:glycosyltransferase family 2 protein [Thermoanaerobaculia bacterium]